MRLALDNGAGRRFGRVRGLSGWALLEIALLLLLAAQAARLAWTMATPLPAAGEEAPPALTRAQALGGFDPFFRLSGAGGPLVVTSLNLRLYGVRQDQASGRGSAIVATPDGQQKSFAVGDEIVPGVTLKAVDFDSVTLSRGGATEQLFMDQSPAAQVVGPATPAAPAPVTIAPPRASPAANPAADVAVQPRMSGRQLTGIIVQPQGSGDGFRALGFAPGDEVVAVNGRRLRSVEDAQAVAGQLGARGVTFQVERDGRVLTLRPGARR
jgi:general secretion pathway protein C